MKKKRQEKLISLIRENVIETQEELCEALKAAGFDVTQATVSRDIKELSVTKVPGDNGRQRYAPGRTVLGGEDKNVTIFREGVVSLDNAGNILVIKTSAGMAMAVAAAVDSMELPEIVGSIAGDDTIMCAVKTEEETEAIKKRLLAIKR